MKEQNGILYLGRQDLTLEARGKKVEDILTTDIATSFKPVQRAEMVFFITEGLMKILKCRYKIVQ